MGRLVAAAVRPIGRLWASDAPLDAYALVHVAAAAGDVLVAIALADSVFFSLPVGQAKVRVALYLGLTMAPLAFAAPLLIPLLDRGGFRRAIAFVAAAGRAGAAIYAASRTSSLVLFPVAFALLVLSKAHGITKNGLTAAYAPPGEGLMRSNGRLGRAAAAGGLLAAGPGIGLAAIGGGAPVLYLAAAVYGVAALLTLRLAQPEPGGTIERERHHASSGLGFPALGGAVLRGASGFLLFLLAFALRRSGEPTSWFALMGGAAIVGGFVADVLAPRFPSVVREEALLVASLIVAGAMAFLAFRFYALPTLVVFAGVVGMTTELGRLAFQSLMQTRTPQGTQGRVFVRFEVVFQLAWVAGAFVAALLPVSIRGVTIIPLSFRGGVLILAVVYLGLGLVYALAGPAHHREEPGPV